MVPRGVVNRDLRGWTVKFPWGFVGSLLFCHGVLILTPDLGLLRRSIAIAMMLLGSWMFIGIKDEVQP